MSREFFQNASTAIFEHLGRIAIYHSQHLNQTLELKVIAQPLDQFYELGDRALLLEQAAFGVRVSELEYPQIGDHIEINGKHYRVSQEPECDPYDLTWGLVTTLDHG